MANWVGERFFHSVFVNKIPNPKDRRTIWEVLEQGAVPNKELHRLMGAAREYFYPHDTLHPELDWTFQISSFRTARRAAEEAYHLYEEALGKEEPPIHHERDVPAEEYRSIIRANGTYKFFINGLGESPVDFGTRSTKRGTQVHGPRGIECRVWNRWYATYVKRGPRGGTSGREQGHQGPTCARRLRPEPKRTRGLGRQPSHRPGEKPGAERPPMPGTSAWVRPHGAFHTSTDRGDTGAQTTTSRPAEDTAGGGVGTPVGQ